MLSFILALSATLEAPTGIQGPPAPPQIYGPPASVPSKFPTVSARVGTEVESIRSSINEGREADQLSRKQAKELRREAGEIGMLQERFSEGGLTDSEQKELQNRAEVLRAITNAKRSGTIK